MNRERRDTMEDHINIVTFHADSKACLAEYIRPLLTEQEKKEINDTMWGMEDPRPIRSHIITPPLHSHNMRGC